ncbi:MAG: helix-turn-helix domain-containing protein [Candidatus Poribacteria bacterium]|nr:helix-turn-helix domain-containing protein [Candidatus Poribacteria bacterium]
MRTWRAYLTERFAANQEAAIRYFKFSLEEYQVDGDTPLLLLALRTVVESQGGISVLAKKTKIAPEALSDILSNDEAPRIDTLSTIFNALGCQLSIEPIADTDHRFKPKCEEGTDVNAVVQKGVEQIGEPPPPTLSQ